jgi:hypothetical protein
MAVGGAMNASPLEDHKEEILLLAHGYRNLAEMKSWMAKKGELDSQRHPA